MALDLVPIWTVILAVSVFMYVLLDGFDLGVGILFLLAPDDDARDTMMASVAPVWDGNETWLVMGGLGMFAAFPTAFSIIFPALYFPVLAMLLALMFRGVAFEFRPSARTSRRLWNRAFFGGSLVATFAQGCVLGKFVFGFEVSGRQFGGSVFDWLHPFVLAVGVGLVFGYALLGSTWLIMKTEGDLHDWARRKAKIALFGVLAFIVMVSVWTPLMHEHIAARWFSWPNLLWFSPVPAITALLALWLWRSLERGPDAAPFIAAMGLFFMCYSGLAVSLFPYIVPHKLTLWEAAGAPEGQAFLLIGTLFLIPVIFTYTGWSYWVFRGKVRGDAGYH
ncbi:MAG: putative transrane cytochrome bd-II oxidase [Betaproteobacteria bacterium]|nr:putative transrane cytochrome bd-II oxidase [Betaproteobacteria bacterium]